MNTVKIIMAASVIAWAAGASVMAAGEAEKEMLTREQAIEMAKATYPGEVLKAYKETKRGREVWEVQIKGEDGKKGEFYYDTETHELVKSEIDDE